MPRWRRAVVAVAALAFLALALFGSSLPWWDLPLHLSGAHLLCLGMIGFHLAPRWLDVPAGRAVPTPHGGERIVTARSTAQRVAHVARLTGVVTWWYALMSSAGSTDDGGFSVLALLVGLATAFMVLVGLADALFRADPEAPGVTFDAHAMTLRGPDGTRLVDYADVRQLEVGATGVWITTSTDRHLVRTADARVAGIVAERVEKERARTRATTGGVDATSSSRAHAAVARDAGASVRAWLARLDALGETRRAAASAAAGAYRGVAVAADDEELWSVLTDASADVDARVGAARVLSRTSDERVRRRVEAHAAAIDDGSLRARFRVATKDDAEQAAAELEAMELEEMKRAAGA